MAVSTAALCLLCLAIGVSFVGAQHGGHEATASAVGAHDRHGTETGWEGSAQGIAYSEFNHHISGLFLLLIGFSEIRHALGRPALAWTRLLLPGAFIVGGIFLLIWSDHDAWPIGSLSFAQTFFGHDAEVVQHKTYGLLALGVGLVEMLRRLGLLTHVAWAVPLPLFAIVGGLMLFGHSHGDHPGSGQIARHHQVMGSLAITAGAVKLLLGRSGRAHLGERSYGELIWAGLVLVIGLQLLIYSE